MTWIQTSFGERRRASTIDLITMCEINDEHYINSNRGFLARDADKCAVRFVFEALKTEILDETPGVWDIPGELERARALQQATS